MSVAVPDHIPDPKDGGLLPPVDHHTADYTLDPTALQTGQLVWLYGYAPAIAFGVEGDGSVELARFGSIEFHQPSDIATVRGPRPTATLPSAPEPGDRIAALEAQVAALVALLSQQGVPAAPAPAPAAPAAAAPAAPEEPPAAPPVVTPFGTAAPASDPPAA